MTTPLPGRAQVLAATRQSLVLAAACLAAYWLAMTLLSRVTAVSAHDDLLGGMWAVIAAIFVLRGSYQQSAAAWLDLRAFRRKSRAAAGTGQLTKAGARDGR